MIEVAALTKRFGKTLAVDNLSFSAEPGRITGFLGPNGAGKTTTMRAVLGLEGGDPLELPLRDVCEVVLACPAPQEPGALVACGSAYRPHLLELDEAGMAFVDRL